MINSTHTDRMGNTKYIFQLETSHIKNIVKLILDRMQFAKTRPSNFYVKLVDIDLDPIETIKEGYNRLAPYVMELMARKDIDTLEDISKRMRLILEREKADNEIKGLIDFDIEEL